MILLIDNYDSFVYNLARYIRELNFPTCVERNDVMTLKDIELLNPSHIILSPGPCTPNEAGITLACIQHFYQSIPILGICLGHQAIGQSFGGKVVRAKQPTHGKSSFIYHNQQGIFNGINNPFKAARYHSLAVSEEYLPESLQIIATTPDGEIMGLQHRQYPVVGLQFHPESILTECGHLLLQNFLQSEIGSASTSGEERTYSSEKTYLE